VVYLGVEVVEVNPAYTSIIGMLKYAPQLSVDKDIAGAYVIGRRALGFKEDTPKNYKNLLKDKAYLEFTLKKYEEREKELRELMRQLCLFCSLASSEGSLLFPILGKVLPRDLSPLKPVLVEEAWDRVRSRLVPLEAGGTVPIRDF